MYSFAKADVSFSLFPLKASRILVTSIGSLISPGLLAIFLLSPLICPGRSVISWWVEIISPRYRLTACLFKTSKHTCSTCFRNSSPISTPIHSDVLGTWLHGHFPHRLQRCSPSLCGLLSVPTLFYSFHLFLQQRCNEHLLWARPWRVLSKQNKGSLFMEFTI